MAFRFDELIFALSIVVSGGAGATTGQPPLLAGPVVVGQSSPASPVPSLSSSESQASPWVSPSVFAWAWFAASWQLSEASTTVSLSSSVSQASPWVSASLSF